MSKVMIVDLNNFARYPTLAIAYLIAPLREAGFTVDVLSPLTIGAPAMTHEREENWREHFRRRFNFGTHPLMQSLHEPLRKTHVRWQSRPHRPTLAEVSRRIESDTPDIILLSAYLDHYPVVKEIALCAQQRGIPVLLGGPAFSDSATIDEWIDLDGVTAIFAGEADRTIVELVSDAIDGKKLSMRPGLFVKGYPNATVAPPLQDLDQLPIPDFDDFPWDDYPHRIIPMMTGRGCSWGVCTFCSDVITANGRTFRSRSLDAVLNEIEVQSNRYGSKDFIFLDLKLNSNLDVWYGLVQNFQRIVPGGRWIATVHVDGQRENGLDYDTLKAAKEAGLTRISFGLETASQKLAQRMAKGTRVERNQQFVEDVWRAGLSLRCSMILGYPGETHDDLSLTRDFLIHNRENFDRIRPSRFKAIPGTPFAQLYQSNPNRFNGLGKVEWDQRYAQAAYRYNNAADLTYRQEKREILRIIHQINRKPLRDDAIQFDGLM